MKNTARSFLGIARRGTCNMYDIPLLPGGSHLYELLSDNGLFKDVKMKTRCIYTNVLYILLVILLVSIAINIINKLSKPNKDKRQR